MFCGLGEEEHIRFKKKKKEKKKEKNLIAAKMVRIQGYFKTNNSWNIFRRT